MENFNLIFPEIFLTLSIFATLLIGVFFKNSYNLVTNITYLIIVSLLLIIFNSFSESGNLFSNSFVSNTFTSFFKILILLGTLFVMFISQDFIKEKKINYSFYIQKIFDINMAQTADGFLIKGDLLDKAHKFYKNYQVNHQIILLYLELHI